MSGSQADFPGRYQVLIGTKSFAVDTSYEAFRRQSFHHDTIPAQRESLELTDVPGEGTINTEGLWRRGQISWHHGSGQLYADRKESDPYRYLHSLGVDPWFENQLSLLPAATQRINLNGSAYNTAKMVVVNGTVWVLQTTIPAAGGPYAFSLQYSDDWVHWTMPSGLPANNITELVTDGANVFIAGFYGSGEGVWAATPSGSTWGAFSKIVNDSAERIFACGNRLFLGQGADLWDITSCTGAAQNLAAGAAVKIFSHPNANWHWADMTANDSFIYAAGNVLLVGESLEQANLGQSGVYQFSTTPSSSGTSTLVNLVFNGLAFQPPYGEQVVAVEAYDNFVFLGTTQGVRCCRSVSPYDPTGLSGTLVSGPLIPNLTEPFNSPYAPFAGVTCAGFIGYGRWVWFDWPAFTYNGVQYNGLGRLDLGNFISDLQPAYASDLMVASSVVSTDKERGCIFWDPVSNGPGFLIPGNSPTSGVYTQDYNVSLSNATKYVTTGYMRTGRITYGMQDDKTLAQANLKAGDDNLYVPFDTAGGSITLDVSYDGGAFQALTPLAPNQQADPPVLVSPLTPAEEIEIEAILTASGSGAQRPFLNRWTIKSLPNVVSGVYIYVALQLYTHNELEGYTDFTDPYGDYAYLENLRLSQQIVTYKEASGTAGATQFTASVVVQELYWMPQQRRDNPDAGYEGVLVVTLKSIVG